MHLLRGAAGTGGRVMLKERFCWNCGASLGQIEDRHYDRFDVCGERACNRAQRDYFEEEREERHRRIDDDYRW